mmetsp:Transcript_27737/g.31128  ORF Transcript_27737/g.31128 Transcript_27737/m.31128 type:complete len:206 (+) Transcript_27737:926-1543(+)
MDENKLTHTLCISLTSNPKNRMISMTVLKILRSIIPFLETGVFTLSRDLMKLLMIEVLENHVENPELEVVVSDILLILCERNDNMKQFLLEESRIRTIISVMQYNLGNDDLQESVCKLSLLSDFGSGKEMIGRLEGITTVINAMLAHNDSVEVQKKGLIALKNLATASINKRMIAEMEGETAVIYSDVYPLPEPTSHQYWTVSSE